MRNREVETRDFEKIKIQNKIEKSKNRKIKSSKSKNCLKLVEWKNSKIEKSKLEISKNRKSQNPRKGSSKTVKSKIREVEI